LQGRELQDAALDLFLKQVASAMLLVADTLWLKTFAPRPLPLSQLAIGNSRNAPLQVLFPHRFLLRRGKLWLNQCP
jgi:hypothetical protein